MSSVIADDDSPTPLDRRARKPCRAAAEGGIRGECIPPGGEAWFLQGPASGPCSPAGPPGGPWDHSGTGFPEGSPRSRGEGAGEGSWAGCQARAACWGAGPGWGPEGRGGTEEAAWSDAQSHPDLRGEPKQKERSRPKSEILLIKAFEPLLSVLHCEYCILLNAG